MSRAEVFNTLEDMGVARAVVQFAGGSDEGDTGQTTFHMVGGEILAAPETSEPQNSEFHTALDEPVYEQYGGFDGGFSAFGGV